MLRKLRRGQTFLLIQNNLFKKNIQTTTWLARKKIGLLYAENEIKGHAGLVGYLETFRSCNQSYNVIKPNIQASSLIEYAVEEDFEKVIFKIEYFPIQQVFIDPNEKISFKLLPEKLTLIYEDDNMADDMSFYSYKKFSLPAWFYGLTKKNKDKIIKWSNFEVFADKVEFDSNQIILNEVAYKSLTIDNAGGSSAYSEALSIEYFIRKFGARDVIYENQVSYWIKFKMCDFICAINGERIGISVTRAMCYDSGRKVGTTQDHHENKPFTNDDAFVLLKKKIEGLIIAKTGVSECHSFYKSILHIWCQSEHILLCCNEMSKKYIKEHPNQASLKGLRIILSLCETPLLYDDKSAKIVIDDIAKAINN